MQKKNYARLHQIQNPPLVAELQRLCSRTVCATDYPHCSSVHENIPIYNPQADQHQNFPSASGASALQDEWHEILLSGPGVFVLKSMYQIERSNLIERANTAFASIIASEKSKFTKGDHFSVSGTNDRIWNSFSKHCMTDPISFLEYYSNPWLALVCDAWLGPAYRTTAQVNIVKPGGAAQVCHRDYHLGFQTQEACALYPKALQVASQMLTLQGAIAHTDMPLASGPTRLLPFSQSFAEGYMAYRLPEFQQFFEENHTSIPLEKGDGIFFNPALFHAAGENKTGDLDRTANLLQISSAFSKTMETVETLPLVLKCWDGLMQKYRREGTSREVQAFVAALADGYPFPTNLDRRPPATSKMAPESEQDVVWRGLEHAWSLDTVMRELERLKIQSET